MNLEPITQSEGSQKEKNQYCVLIHIYGIQKHGTDESMCGAAMEVQTQRADSWTRVGEEKEGEMNEEGIVEAYTPPYVKPIASGNLQYDSGNSHWASATIYRGGKAQEVGGGLKREETHIHLWLIHVDGWQKANHDCKAISLQLKINNFL